VNGSAVCAWSSNGFNVSGGTLTVAGGTITTGSTTALSLNTGGASTQVQIAHTASAVNYLNISGAATTTPPYVFVGGADTNIGLDLATKGTGNFRFITGGYVDSQVHILHTASANRFITLTGSNGSAPTIGTSAGNLWLAPAGMVCAQLISPASSVNNLNFSGGSTGNPVYIQAAGSDTNVGLRLIAQTSTIDLESTGGTTQVRVLHTASANRYITLTGSNGAAPIIGTSAGDLAFSPAGTERMRINSSGNVGIGTASPTANYKLTLNTGGISFIGTQAANVTGAIDTQSYSMANGTYQYLSIFKANGLGGGAVGQLFGGYFQGQTEASAYTTGEVAGIKVGTHIKGAGSTITSAFGVIVDDQTVGTNNYGIHLNLSAGTNKYNIYAAGTADNYFAGNVGIGTASPNASAILDAQSTTKGVRMPNMTTTQKNAIASPAAGLMVFDTTLAKLCVYSGSAWQTITSV
jgi:hypothetical protein